MKPTFFETKMAGSKTLAYADVDVAEGIVVRGFRIINGVNGLFASVPTKPYTVNGETRFARQVVFSDPNVRERFLGAVLDAYKKWKLLSDDSPSPQTAESPPPTD